MSMWGLFLFIFLLVCAVVGCYEIFYNIVKAVEEMNKRRKK